MTPGLFSLGSLEAKPKTHTHVHVCRNVFMYLRGKTKTIRFFPNFHVPLTGEQHFASPGLLWDDYQCISHNHKTSRQVPLLSVLLEFGSADSHLCF